MSLASAASGGLVAGPLTYSHSCALKTCTYKEAADRRMDQLMVVMSVAFCLLLTYSPGHCSSDSHRSLRHAGPGKPADRQ